MNRREALKNIGLSFGIIVGGPTAITMLQGCSGNPSPNWIPEFFSEDEAFIITQFVDIILPSTEDTPGASEVGVPRFIDRYLQEVVDTEEQQRTRQYLAKTVDKMKTDANVENAISLTKEDIVPEVSYNLNKSPEEEKEVIKKLDNYVQSNQTGSENHLFQEVASYALLTNLRGLAIWSYKTSQMVGENILAYESIPARQRGCVNVEEATGGKAWAL